MMNFRIVEIDGRDAAFATEGQQLKKMTEQVAKTENEGYEFYSLTFIGVAPSGDFKFIAAFRRAP